MKSKSFGEILTDLMVEKDISPTDIANASGLNRCNLYNCLSGRRKNPSLSTVIAICDAFDISMDYFRECTCS